MSEAESASSERGKYTAAKLRQRGTPGEPAHIAGAFRAAPIRHEAAPMFRAQVSDLCPTCRMLIAPEYWQSPDGVPESVIHFNATQTAFLNTACQLMYQLTGDETYLTNKAFTLTTVCQLFLKTDPVVALRMWDVRPARVERGAARDADWVEVIEPETGADNVTDADASTGTAPPVEPIEPSAVDELYGEAGDGSDLYRERGE